MQDILSNETMELYLRGMASQLSEKGDHILCSDVRNKLFGPLEFSRRDLGEYLLIYLHIYYICTLVLEDPSSIFPTYYDLSICLQIQSISLGFSAKN